MVQNQYSAQQLSQCSPQTGPVGTDCNYGACGEANFEEQDLTTSEKLNQVVQHNFKDIIPSISKSSAGTSQDHMLEHGLEPVLSSAVYQEEETNISTPINTKESTKKTIHISSTVQSSINHRKSKRSKFGKQGGKQAKWQHPQLKKVHKYQHFLKSQTYNCVQNFPNYTFYGQRAQYSAQIGLSSYCSIQPMVQGKNTQTVILSNKQSLAKIQYIPQQQAIAQQQIQPSLLTELEPQTVQGFQRHLVPVPLLSNTLAQQPAYYIGQHNNQLVQNQMQNISLLPGPVQVLQRPENCLLQSHIPSTNLCVMRQNMAHSYLNFGNNSMQNSIAVNNLAHFSGQTSKTTENLQQAAQENNLCETKVTGYKGILNVPNSQCIVQQNKATEEQCCKCTCYNVANKKQCSTDDKNINSQTLSDQQVINSRNNGGRYLSLNHREPVKNSCHANQENHQPSQTKRCADYNQADWDTNPPHRDKFQNYQEKQQDNSKSKRLQDPIYIEQGRNGRAPKFAQVFYKQEQDPWKRHNHHKNSQYSYQTNSHGRQDKVNWANSSIKDKARKRGESSSTYQNHSDSDIEQRYSRDYRKHRYRQNRQLECGRTADRVNQRESESSRYREKKGHKASRTPESTNKNFKDLKYKGNHRHVDYQHYQYDYKRK